MADSYIQVAPDSTGKKMATFETTQGVDTVEIEKVVLTDSSGTELSPIPVSLRLNELADPLAIAEVPQGSATFGPSNSTSSAYEASRVINGATAVLFCVTGFNSKASAQFIQLFNATALPAEGSPPVITFRVPASSNFSLDFGGKFGRYFSNGIVICNSSTGPTKTIGSADCWFDAQYEAA